MAFQIFTDTSSGLAKDLREQYGVDYFMMRIVVNGKEYKANLDYVDFTREELFSWVDNPDIKVRTSLIPAEDIISQCEPYLKKGIDILYISCAEALSGSRGIFEIAKQELLDKYPDRKMVSINSCRAEMGLGMLVIEATKLQKEGKSLEEVYKWVEDNREFYHEVGSVDTLKHLRAFGRVSGAAAFFVDTFNIKPLIVFDVNGLNTTIKKIHGNKKMLLECFDYIKENMIEGVTDEIYIGEAMPIPGLDFLKNRLESELHLKVKSYIISPIVGICCGPTMFGCYFRGKEVTLQPKKEK